MPYPDMSGFLSDPRGYTNPDMNGFRLQPLPRTVAPSGSDMSGFRAPISGYNAGTFGTALADGPQWSTVSMPAVNNSIIVPSNGVVIFANGTASNTVIMRLDLRDPTLTVKQLVAPVSADWAVGAADGKGTIILIGSRQSANNNYIISKDNGLTWTALTMPTLSLWYVLEWGNGVFLAMVYNTSTAYTSADGYNWTLATGLAVRNWRGAAADNTGRWVANADSTGICGVSLDGGQTWAVGGTASLNTSQRMAYGGVCGGGYFFYCSPGAAATGVFTRDGTNWISVTLPLTPLESAYGNGLYLFTNIGAGVAISPDPLLAFVSTKNQMPVAGTWIPAFGGGEFMATSSGVATMALGVF